MVWELQEKKVVGAVPIVTEEGELPVGPPPEIPPITPVGPPIPGLKPAEIVKPSEGFLEEHKIVKKFVDRKGYSYKCVTPQEIVDETGLSLEVVELHLEVMQLDEAAKYIHKGDNPMVCAIDAMARLVENLRRLKV